jgi:DNA polymerase III subunit epsilon
MTREQARREAIATAQIKVNRQPVYLDTETTGLNATDQIVEICLIDSDGRCLFESLVKPTGQIPLEATRVHGITSAMVADAPAWREVWPQVESALTGRPLGIFNAEYDLRLMEQSHRVHGLDWSTPACTPFCIMKLYAQFRGEWDARRGAYRWQSLENARLQCRLELPNAHRARADALLARAVLQFMAQQS